MLVAEWRRSGRRLAQVKVFAGTMMAYNPAYTGSAIRNKGSFRLFYATSIQAETEGSVADLIDYVFNVSKATDKRAADAASIEAQAQERLVWIHRIHFRFFNAKPRRETTLKKLDTAFKRPRRKR